MHIRNEIKFFLRKFGIDISRYNFIENFDYRLKYFLDIHTRVKLKSAGIPDDYINANYLKV